MRKPSAWVIGGVLLLLLLGAGVFWWRASTAPSLDDPSASRPPPRQRLAAPPPPPRGALQVRGRVQDARGQPVAGIPVSATVGLPGETLSELPCDTAKPDVDTSLASSDCTSASAWQWALEMVESRRGGAFVLSGTTSAPDGTFTLEGLPQGKVSLWALGPDGAALEEDVTPGTDDVTLVLVSGHRLSGRVVDEDGVPLPATRLTVVHSGSARYFEAQADAEGHFTVGPLPEAVYTLAASHPGKLPVWLQGLEADAMAEDLVMHPPRRIVGVVLDGERPVVGATVVEQDGDRLSVTDAQGRFTFDDLLPSTYALNAEQGGERAFEQVELTEHQSEAEVTLHLGTAFFLEATVRDTAGRPVAGASVVALGTNGDLTYGMGTAELLRESDAEGHVRLGPLLARAYSFKVSAERLLDFELEKTVARGDPPLEFVLSPAVVVEGQVTNAEGQPVADASLSLLPPQELPPPPRPEPRHRGYRIIMHPPRHEVRTFDATSDETGHFVLKVDKPLTGVLTVEAEGLLPRKLQVQAPTSGLRLALDSGAVVRGTVTSSDGAPVRGVDVTLVKDVKRAPETDPETAPETSGARERTSFAASTEEDGRFTIRGMPPGAYAVWVRATASGGYEQKRPERVEVRGSETVELALRLDLDGRIEGVVVDARGQPLAGANVGAYARAAPDNEIRIFEPMSVKTGPDGRFVLERLARDTDYELDAQAPGYVMPRPPEEPPPDDDDEATTPGELRARVDRWIHTQEDPKVVARTGNLAVRIVLASQGRITGRLVKGNGAPITRFSVNDEPVRDPHGAFTVFVAEPGLEHLTFQVPGHALTQRDVKVPPGRDVDLGEVRIDTGHTVRGRVVDDATGKPLEGVNISLRLPRDALNAQDVAEEEEEALANYTGFSSFLDATTGPDGTFTLPAVESRPYVLTARHPGSDYASIERTLGPTEDTVELRLVGETRLEVRVTGPDGQPHGAMVSARAVRAFEAKNFLSEGDGLTVFRDLEPGDYVVGPRARSEEYAAPYKTVRVEPHRVTRTEFQLLPKGATVTVRWGERGPQGQTFLFPGPIPLPTSDEEREQLHWSALRTGSQGNDSWSNVAPGPYTLVVLHHQGGGRWASHRQDVTVGTGDTQEVVVPTIQW